MVRKWLVVVMAMALVVMQAGAAASVEDSFVPPPEAGELVGSFGPADIVFEFGAHPCVDPGLLRYNAPGYENAVYDQGEVDDRGFPVFLYVEGAPFTTSYPDGTPTGFSGEYQQWFTFSEDQPGDGTFRFLDNYIYGIGTDGRESFELLVYATGSAPAQFTVLVFDCFPADVDSDGVLDADDLCDDTSLPDEFEDKKNRYGVAQPGANFVDPFGTDSGISIADTYGCSGEQIADAVGGRSHQRFGPTKSLLLDWIADNA